MTTEPRIDRRRAMAGVGLGLPILAACGGNDPDSASEPATRPSGALAATSDIEPGSGAVFPDERVVVTQPSDGEFRAFTAVCTHAGCMVDSVSDGRIHCPCHGSEFSIEDGSVVGGPAPEPLKEIPIEVRGDTIRLS